MSDHCQKGRWQWAGGGRKELQLQTLTDSPPAEPGRDALINPGFASDLNTSAYKVLVYKTGQILTSIQPEFDENFFPYRKEELISKLDEGDNETDILSERHLILQSPHDPDAYLKVDQETFFKNLLTTATEHEKARLAVGPLDCGRQTRIKGLPDSIDPAKPPKNFRDAMLRDDSQERAAALDKEHRPC